MKVASEANMMNLRIRPWLSPAWAEVGSGSAEPRGFSVGVGPRVNGRQWRDGGRVRFLERKIIVDRQLVDVRQGVPAFGPPKTRSSVRDIPLPATVAEALARHIESYPPGPDGLLFTTTHGNPWRRTTFGEVWRAKMKAAKLDGFDFHELRHYYASLLIRYGESIKTVQARLGHESAEETLNTYSHLWSDSDDRSRDAVDAALRAESGENAGSSPDSQRTPS